jgi:hypothetical protein
VSLARRFVAELLAGCPARETLVTCVSELCANAIAHTASGRGGVFVVEVDTRRDGVARIAVTDDGADGVPVPGALDLTAEGGRGLAMVAACTSRWGYADAFPGRIVWAEATWPVAVRSYPSPHPSPHPSPQPRPARRRSHPNRRPARPAPPDGAA